MVCLPGLWECCQVSEWFVCQACGKVVKYLSGVFVRPVGMLSSIRVVCLSGLWEGCQVSEWFVCQAWGKVVKYLSGLFVRPVGMLSSI